LTILFGRESIGALQHQRSIYSENYIHKHCLHNNIRKLEAIPSLTLTTEMDPHSRLNQYNQRPPKSGPPPAPRFPTNMLLKPSLENFPSTLSPTKPKPGSEASTFLVRRPIATNSRIKQNENYRKDMYLAFVNNALQQKLTVRAPSLLANLFSLNVSLGKLSAV